MLGSNFYYFWKRSVHLILIFSLLFSPASVYAQSAFVSTLPEPGKMIEQSSVFVPVLVRGLAVHPEKPLYFEFLVDSGNDSSDQTVIKEQGERIAKYFLAAVTVPEEQLWVNLSPYEQDRIIDEGLGQTVLGRDMLAQDYVLKQLTSSLIYPEKGLGKDFWARIYQEAQDKFGTTDIPVDTFNKVWIMPEKAEVFEKGNAVYVTQAKLKVMLDSDRLAMAKNESDAVSNEKAAFTKALMREIVIPAIEREVNEGRNFSVIRQVYYAAILAKWYRERIQNTLLADAYVGKNRVAGVLSDEKALKEEIYQRYIAAYKKGVFNYIKDDVNAQTGETLARKYFSGGVADFGLRDIPLSRAGELAMAGRSVGETFKVELAMSAGGIQNSSVPVWWRDVGKTQIVMSLPVSALRREKNDAGIGKFTDLPVFYREAHRKQGVTVLNLLPHYAIAYESPYAPVSLYALNEDNIDWGSAIKMLSVDGRSISTLASPDKQREIDFQDVRRREHDIAGKVYDLFKERHIDRRTDLALEFEAFISGSTRLGRELQSYAQFMATHETGKSGKNVEVHLFAQWLAYRQLKEALADIHAEGGRVIFDVPFFRGKDGVDVREHPKYFRDVKDKSPGLNKPWAKFSWQDLALWNWNAVKENDFEFITAPFRHWLDFGFDGARLDAIHFAYDIGQDNALNEPGDALVGVLGKLFKDRNAFVVAEAFEGMKDKVERHGILAIDGIFKRLSTHDDNVRRYHENGANFNKDFLNARREDANNAETSGFIGVTIGDLEGDDRPIKIEKDGSSYWRYRIPMPQDPDYQKRAGVDQGAFVEFHTQAHPQYYRQAVPVLEDPPEVLALVRDIFNTTADSFIKHFNRNGAEVVEIWAASRDWFFEQWGRDTFIALPGTLLATGRFEEAKAVIRSFAKFEKDGLIPNRIPDSQHPEWNEYNTVDGPMWFIASVKKYLEYTDDQEFAVEMLPVVRRILAAYEKGTGFDQHKHINADPKQNVRRIAMDSNDKLIISPSQATWMDADPHGHGAVTPRNGKAVEINALWYANLKFLTTLLSKARDSLPPEAPQFDGIKDVKREIRRLEKLAGEVKESFNAKFWNDRLWTDGSGKIENCLFDVIEGDPHGGAVRPNMIFAVSHGEDLLSSDRQQKVLEAVTNDLLTPKGLRTLSPRDRPNYKSFYDTDSQPFPGEPMFYKHKDYSYHQGTVWPWLIGAYVDATVRVMRDQGKSTEEIRSRVKDILSPLVTDLLSMGSLHEVYDAEPRQDGQRRPGGTSSQTWSVAEVFRPLMEYGILPDSKREYLSSGQEKAQAIDTSTGGIDIQNINVTQSRSSDGEKIKFDSSALRELIQDGFNGFTPVIINITPIQNPSIFLGVKQADLIESKV
ncbi:MAG: 4-alpha-glucanotransferase [Candidatus Omnitrophica bacterium]|nr:4-alpha-glucanotransferase [Candidatus Omnitrophota bacterium]